MRTDVKVALGVVLVLIAGMVIYFLGPGRHVSQTTASIAPHVSQGLEPNTQPMDTGPAAAPLVIGPGSPSLTLPRPGAEAAATEPAGGLPQVASNGGQPAAPGAAVPTGFGVMPPPMTATTNSATLAGGATVNTATGAAPPPFNSGFGNTLPNETRPGAEPSWRNTEHNTDFAAEKPDDSRLSPAAGGSDRPASSAADTYTIRKGDMLYSIAKAHGVSLKALEKANPRVNPNRLRIGEKLTIPASAAAASGEASPSSSGSAAKAGSTGRAASSKTYTVKSGDTLAGIARSVYGNAGRWKDIAAANRISNPRSIRVGMVLKLPAK
jgi:nucleoid-associated protein YgaU